MFTVEALIAGVIGAYIVGISKTGLPGAALVSIPLFATVFDGRLIPGATLPVLIVADVFAVAWYHQHTRWDLLRPLAVWIAVGYGFGIAFFVAVGSASRSIEVVIGVIVLSIVALQSWRMVRSVPTRPATTGTAAVYGTTGGFTTFVANAAGPVINTYLIALGIRKDELIGTSAWLYFAINVTKIPLYVAVGELTSGGPFFTADSLLFDLAIAPAVLVGVFSGRALFHLIPQRTFLLVVLGLSAAGSLKLLV